MLTGGALGQLPKNIPTVQILATILNRWKIPPTRGEIEDKREKTMNMEGIGKREEVMLFSEPVLLNMWM